MGKRIQGIRSYWNKPYHAAYLFILPAAILLLVFNVIPLFASFYISTLDIGIAIDKATFVGLDNYIEALHDSRFLNSIKVTIFFTAVEVPIQMVMGLVMSALLTKNTFTNKLFRSIYFLPIICSATAIGIMFQIILHSNVGIVTYWVRMLGFGKINFLYTPGLTMGVVIAVSLWRTFGISTIILISAMQNVPSDYYEAAYIDGAGKVRQFFSITLPCIMPAFWFLLMTRVIGSLQVFDLIYTLTDGGPNFTTETLVAYVYTKAFDRGSRMGYATAMSEFLFVFIMIITLIQYYVMSKTED
ncbi:MAG: sugar ABC transporter permease [Butyrivibrio sp.]|nr:sugar ABC transporter permease [Butyrivibrio sp.]